MRLKNIFPGMELVLAAAIIKQAVDDYCCAVKSGNRRKYDSAVDFFTHKLSTYLLSFFCEQFTGNEVLHILERRVGFDEKSFNARCEEYEKCH